MFLLLLLFVHVYFQETKRPSKEMQVTIARQLGLDASTVSNFFMNARRRSIDKWREDSPAGGGGGGGRTVLVTSAAGAAATVLTGSPATLVHQLNQFDLAPGLLPDILGGS